MVTVIKITNGNTLQIVLLHQNQGNCWIVCSDQYDILITEIELCLLSDPNELFHENQRIH